jgi:hypothetical protein
MADVAKRLCGPVLLTGTVVTYYTVPAATTTIIRSIHVNNGGGTANTLTLGIGGVTIALSLFYQFPLGGNGAVDWSGFLVMSAGETLQVLANNVNVLSLTVSGVETS